MFLKCCKLKIYWCYLYVFVIQAVIWLKGGPCRESMHEKSVSHTRIQDFSFFFLFVGGVGGGEGGGWLGAAWKQPWQFS